jgi:PAS domain S-box-containing protein
MIARLRAGEPGAFHAEFRMRRADAGAVWIALRGEPLTDEAGRVRGAHGVAYDVDDWMGALQALRASAMIFHSFAEASRDFMWIADPRTNRTHYINPAYEQVIGGPRKPLEESFEYWRKVVHPDDIARAEDGIRLMMAGTARDQQLRIIRPDDGRVRVLDDRGFPILDEKGDVRLIGGIVRDITDSVQAREELERRVAERTRELEESLEERRRAEASLAQAQRLETVGRLTGGVAHDFNNLLMVMVGALDMIQRHPDRPDRIRRYTAAALEAGARGERLTRQLLSFSRTQELRPEPVELHAAILGFEPLLRGAAGEDAPLSLEIDADAGVARLDKAQLEAALLNLVINAKDALGDAGTIRLQARRVTVKAGEVQGVEPGDYARLSVIDTGAGMSPETAARAFEPFFTTKPVGKGSGLGLAQVYGFAVQSGGGVRIDSAPGQGATVSLYLPLAAQREEPAAPPAPPAPGAALPKPCHVLLVDDEAGVRAIAEALLRDLGCDVVTAPDGPTALEALKANPCVRLLFSDVVMPGMSGVELAREAQALRPDLKVLLSTGYASNRLETADAAWPVLRKPYQAADLARSMRLALT